MPEKKELLRYNFNIDSDKMAVMRAIAALEKKTVSNVMRNLVENYIKANKDKLAKA